MRVRKICRSKTDFHVPGQKPDPGHFFPALRDKFKRKDHTTVVYACERVEKEIKRDQSTKAVIDELTKQLKR